MSSASRQAHWEGVYTNKGENEVSWFQESPAISLELIAETAATTASRIIDIGGGASRLVDSLLSQGFLNVTVLDLSATALAAAQARIGENAYKVRWIAADATTWAPADTFDVWHDRAAFHFLTTENEQAAYVQRLKQGLRKGGYAIIGTFAIDGPETCSGLPVARHTSDTLAAILGADFVLVGTRYHAHATPWQVMQKFQFSTFRKIA
jgi:2-polyprenyl-3-methyl-5-hydroxy-6-metoxy-1,4-benzoquinol methylase